MSYPARGVRMPDELYQRVLDETEHRGSDFPTVVMRELIEERLNAIELERIAAVEVEETSEEFVVEEQSFEEPEPKKVGFWGKLLGKDRDHV